MCEVQAHHEWCAEAYMETDYVAITENQLSTSAKKYFLNNIMTMHDIRVEADN